MHVNFILYKVHKKYVPRVCETVIFRKMFCAELR